MNHPPPASRIRGTEMLLIKCPICGVEANDADFLYGGEAHIKRPASTDPEAVSDEAQYRYLYERKNPRGVHQELWQCARGCGKWFHATRDTVTQEFLAYYKISDPIPAIETRPTVTKGGKS